MGFSEFDRGISSETIRREKLLREKRELEDEIDLNWIESEQVLSLLRMVGTNPPDVSDRSRWFFKECLQLGESFKFSQWREYENPNQWFNLRFPEQVRRFGSPFFTQKIQKAPGLSMIVPVRLNEDFFAAALGGPGRLGHQLVFCPTTGFWFLDARFGAFCPVSEGKLEILLSNYLLRCAEQMPSRVEVLPLIDSFRRRALLSHVVDRAKVLLEIDSCFFEGPTGRPRRIAGRVVEALPEPSPMLFLKSCVLRQEGAKLTIREAYDHYARFCESRGLIRVDATSFRAALKEAVFLLFNVRLRHDLVEPDGRHTHGWKHVKISDTLPESTLRINASKAA